MLILIAFWFLRPKPPKPVATEKANRGDIIQSISITGSVSAEKSVDLTFQIGGTIAWLGVQKGDTVTAFQTIATLDARTAQKNLQAALIDYSLQRNTFDQTQDNNQGRTPENALNDAMKRILQNNQFDLDKAVNSVELQDLAKQKSVLATPIAGIVTREDVNTSGVNITPATTFTVTDPATLSFRMEVDEADIARVRQGERVELTLDPYPNDTLKLEVSDIDFVTHTTSSGGNAYYVKAALPENTDLKYRVGMNGNADIITGGKNSVLIISLSSLQNDNEVYVKSGNKFELRKIKTGLQNDTSTEVVSGLSEGDEVAADPTSIPKNEIKTQK